MRAAGVVSVCNAMGEPPWDTGLHVPLVPGPPGHRRWLRRAHAADQVMRLGGPALASRPLEVAGACMASNTVSALGVPAVASVPLARQLSLRRRAMLPSLPRRAGRPT